MFNLTHTKRSADKNKILYFTSQLDEDQKLAYWQCFRRKEEREVAQSFPTLCDPIDCSLLGFSIHGIFQARVLEWVAIFFSRGSSRPRDQTRSPTLQADALPFEPPGKPKERNSCISGESWPPNFMEVTLAILQVYVPFDTATYF